MNIDQIQGDVLTRLTSVSDFNTSVGGRVYANQAPQDITYPYCTFFIFGAPQTRDSENLYEDFRLQIQIHQNVNNSGFEVTNSIASKLTALMDNTETTFTFTNYDLIRIDRDVNLTLPLENDIERYQIDYLINLQGK